MYKRYYMFGDKHNTCVMLKDLKKLKDKITTGFNMSMLLTFKDKKKNCINLNYVDSDKLEKDLQFLKELEQSSNTETVIAVFILFVVGITIAVIAHSVLTFIIKLLFDL